MSPLVLCFLFFLQPSEGQRRPASFPSMLVSRRIPAEEMIPIVHKPALLEKGKKDEEHPCCNIQSLCAQLFFSTTVSVVRRPIARLHTQREKTTTQNNTNPARLPPLTWKSSLESVSRESSDTTLAEREAAVTQAIGPRLTSCQPTGGQTLTVWTRPLLAGCRTLVDGPSSWSPPLAAFRACGW